MKVLGLVVACVIVLYLVWGLLGYLTGERQHTHEETTVEYLGSGRWLKFCGLCKEWYE